MKFAIQFFLLLVTIKSSLYAQENVNSANDLQQREKAIKEWIQQKLKNNIPIEDIRVTLEYFAAQTPEAQKRSQLGVQFYTLEAELKQCKEKQETEELKKMKQAFKTATYEYEQTPEAIALWQISRVSLLNREIEDEKNKIKKEKGTLALLTALKTTTEQEIQELEVKRKALLHYLQS
jgi:hypothetical protein